MGPEQPERVPAYMIEGEPESLAFIPAPETGYTLDEFYELFGPGPAVDDEGNLINDGHGLTAAAIDTTTGEIHTGAMIALVPTIEDAERLAYDGGEPLDQLHMTLVYLGEAADISNESRLKLLDAIGKWAVGRPSVVARAFSINIFNPVNSGEFDPCIVVGLGGDDLESFNDEVVEIAEEAGVDTSLSKRPWIPHVTLTYLVDDMTDMLYGLDVPGLAGQRMGEVTFDRLRVAFGGEVHDFTLQSLE